MAVKFDGPSVFGLNRHGVPLLPGTDRFKMQRGAYTISEPAGSDYQVTLVSTGGDLFRAADAAQQLERLGIPARVVSMPCMRRFEQQDEAYQRSVFSVGWETRRVIRGYVDTWLGQVCYCKHRAANVRYHRCS